MATVTRQGFDIIRGPSRDDLFEALKLRSMLVYFVVMTRDGRRDVDVYIDSLKARDDTGETWIFEATEDLTRSKVWGIYSPYDRGGYYLPLR